MYEGAKDISILHERILPLQIWPIIQLAVLTKIFKNTYSHLVLLLIYSTKIK